MKSLIESNRYLADPATRKAMIRHNAHQSSAFEGARGLLPQPLRSVPKRRSKAVMKKAIKGS